MPKSCATSPGAPCLVPRSNGLTSAGSPPRARCPGSAFGSDSTAATSSAGGSCNRHTAQISRKSPGEADLGFRLLRRHWRRGYAAEGARELIRYGFGGVGLNRIFAQTMAVNTPSRATLAAVGLTFARAFVSGDPYDDLVLGAEQGEVEYEITRSTWQQRHRGTGP